MLIEIIEGAKKVQVNINNLIRIESMKTTSMEDVSTGVLKKIKNI